MCSSYVLGGKIMKPPDREGPGDWAEDYMHENGNYQNTCCLCNLLFCGHKRRVVCKACTNLALIRRIAHFGIGAA